jgi:hypothetical protein
MNRSITFTLIALLLLSCSERKEKYNIVGYIDNCNNGDSIQLAYSPNGVTLEEISQSYINDKKFAFNGYIENSKHFPVRKGRGRFVYSVQSRGDDWIDNRRRMWYYYKGIL